MISCKPSIITEYIAKYLTCFIWGFVIKESLLLFKQIEYFSKLLDIKCTTCYDFNEGGGPGVLRGATVPKLPRLPTTQHQTLVMPATGLQLMRIKF